MASPAGRVWRLEDVSLSTPPEGVSFASAVLGNGFGLLPLVLVMMFWCCGFETGELIAKTERRIRALDLDLAYE